MFRGSQFPKFPCSDPIKILYPHSIPSAKLPPNNTAPAPNTTAGSSSCPDGAGSILEAINWWSTTTNARSRTSSAPSMVTWRHEAAATTVKMKSSPRCCCCSMKTPLTASSSNQPLDASRRGRRLFTKWPHSCMTCLAVTCYHINVISRYPPVTSLFSPRIVLSSNNFLRRGESTKFAEVLR